MGTDKRKGKGRGRDWEDLLFMAWFLWMAVYYGFRMFALTPWYDELYTYYYFISRGPVYAAIHWPLPNNHVGYSVLSAILDWFGNPYIGLRGISYLGALANLVLLYQIGKNTGRKGWSFCCTALYSCMNLVNQLAVQGRGYTLAVSCYLVSVLMLQKIGLEKEYEKKYKKNYKKKEGERCGVKHYVIFSLSLTLGLYVLPSSVYWVLPVCISGGVFLLLCRKKKELLRLVTASAAAAVGTVALYALIWLAIGSNLLSKAEGGPYFGQGHVSIILAAPFKAVKTGMEYMLATPYIQSVAREGYLKEFGLWLRSLLNYFYSGAGIFLAAVIAAGCIAAAVSGVKTYRALMQEKMCMQEKLFFSVFLAVTIVLTPAILILQCKLPYFRVFSYMGIPFAMLLCGLLQKISCFTRPFTDAVIYKAEKLCSCLARSAGAGKKTRISRETPGEDKVPPGAGAGIWAAAAAILASVLLLSGDYNNEYGMTEYYARDALAHADVMERGAICVTDCYQQYLLRFCYGIECEDTRIEDADLVLIHREMGQKEPETFRWEFYHSYASIPWEYVESMDIVYENEEYTVYGIKK